MLDTQRIVADLAAATDCEEVRAEGSVHVFPTTVEQVSRVLRYANGRLLSVHPTGAGTKPWGRPVDAAIVLHTAKLNTVKEHVWEDMTATVEAGATWSSLQSTLKEHGQFVALDPLFADTATVGGVIASNDSGVLRMKYGSLRDLIIGMTIVLADGTIARSGGKVVKNVAGYDMHKLMTGAFGTLGVIAEVTFRLHSVTPHARSFSVRFDDAEQAGDLLLQLTGSQLSLHALQLRCTAEGLLLDIALASMPSVVEQQLVELRRLCAPRVVEEASADVWDERELMCRDDRAVVAKATMLPSAIARVSALVRRLHGSAVAQASGIMTVALPAEADVVTLRRETESSGGTLTILRQPGRTEPWGASPDTLALMQSIKRNLDPNRILNPDHFLPGI